jgi:hypothetical protein
MWLSTSFHALQTSERLAQRAAGVAWHEELREGVAAVIVHDMGPLHRQGAMEAQCCGQFPQHCSLDSQRVRLLDIRALAS